MLFLCYPKCSTCQKAKAFLEEARIPFTERHIKEQRPSADELRAWHEKSGLALKKFFNTSGLSYKALGLKDKLPTLSEQQQFELLAADGMLLRRPLLIGADFVLVGFLQKQWEEALF